MTSYPLTAYPFPPYAAALRVYEPLAAFPDAARERWRAYASSGQAPSTGRGPALERAAGLAALLGLPPRVVPDLPEHAYVTEVEGITLVCPWRTRQRSWAALARTRAALPESLVETWVPPGLADRAADDLERWRTEHPEEHVHVLSSTWQVPLHWFVLVDAQERQVTAGPAGGGADGRALLYRTEMSRARRRTARALAVLRRTVDASATSGVEELARWLEEFHPRSLVELDYGGLVHLLDDEALLEDESARDVAAALAALGEGQGDAAQTAYARVSGRMKALQAVESAG